MDEDEGFVIFSSATGYVWYGIPFLFLSLRVGLVSAIYMLSAGLYYDDTSQLGFGVFRLSLQYPFSASYDIVWHGVCTLHCIE